MISEVGTNYFAVWDFGVPILIFLLLVIIIGSAIQFMKGLIENL